MNEKRLISEQIAEMLLRTKAVTLSPDNPYRWSSGLRSPIYCDNRITLSDVDARKAIKRGLSLLILDRVGTEMIAGVATAGIAQGAIVADMLDLPFCYVRPEPKDHGKKNQIEGRLLPGAKTIVIEDLISTGGSSLKVVQALRDAGASVDIMVSIFTYGFDKAKTAFEQANVKLDSLTDYATLIAIAEEQRYISLDQRIMLQDWSDNPQQWSQNYLATQK